MDSVENHSLISPDKIKIEDGLLDDGQIVLEGSQEVGPKVLELVKCESASINSALACKASINAMVDFTTPNAEDKSIVQMSEGDVALNCAEMSSHVDLVTEIKKEIEDKKDVDVLRPLVGFFQGNLKVKMESEKDVISPKLSYAHSNSSLWEEQSQRKFKIENKCNVTNPLVSCLSDNVLPKEIFLQTLKAEDKTVVSLVSNLRKASSEIENNGVTNRNKCHFDDSVCNNLCDASLSKYDKFISGNKSEKCSTTSENSLETNRIKVDAAFYATDKLICKNLVETFPIKTEMKLEVDLDLDENMADNKRRKRLYSFQNSSNSRKNSKNSMKNWDYNIKYFCPICHKYTKNGLECVECFFWYHFGKCCGVTYKVYKTLSTKNSARTYICSSCRAPKSLQINNYNKNHGKATDPRLSDKTEDKSLVEFTTCDSEKSNFSDDLLNGKDMLDRTIKLADVFVKLDDLFSMNDRRLGRAHSNDGLCPCIYCCGEYKNLNNNSCQLSKNLTNEKGLLPALNLNSGSFLKILKGEEKYLNSESCSQMLDDKKNLNSESCSQMLDDKNLNSEFFPQILKDKEKNLNSRSSRRVLKCKKKKRYKCEKCHKELRNKNHLTVHMRVHTGERPFSCSLCDAAFREKRTLMSHQRTHTGERPFSCSLCPAAFHQRNGLQEHQFCHTDKRPFSCNLCFGKFKTMRTLRSHLRTHCTEKPFHCKLCFTTFKSESHLKLHMRRHAGERLFSCDLCSRRFLLSHDVIRHKKSVHCDEKPFRCDVCSATFKLKQNLIYHMRNHSGERPFKCDLCLRKFKQKATLKSHVKTHASQKVWVCAFCPATFDCHVCVNKHMTVHDGNGQHSCKYCSANYKKRDQLARHVKTCHSKKI